MERQAVEIYVDGTALPTNPGTGGAGIVFSTWVNGLRYTLARGVFLGINITNNAAEISAAIEALKALTRPCEVTIYSDSMYLIKTMTDGWKRNSNQDLWSALESAAARHKVTWQWIKGHAGDLFNEWAHDMAEKAARRGEDVSDDE